VSTQPTGQRALEQGALLAALVCLGGVVASLARALDDTGDALGAVAGAGLGYALADLVSGLVHWGCDRFGSSATPVLGPRLIAPFREHHERPEAMVEHDFAELVGSSLLAVTPIWAASWWWVGAGSAAWQGFALALGLATGLTNVLHRWAHVPEPPRTVRWLQRHRLILSRAEHARHHAPPFATHYCVTTGWWNGPLARSGVLEWLEWRLKVGGRPRAPRRRPH
jgi:ubiquitin-conjugating enzyme E2 variant